MDDSSSKKSNVDEVWDLTKKENLIVYIANSLKDDLKISAKLVELKISRVELSNQGAVILSGILKGNPYVQKLDLSWNKIGRHGARHITDILLAKDCNLKSLSLKVI